MGELAERSPQVVPARAGMPQPRTKLPLVLWLATAAFIVYGTTIPFNFVPNSRMAAEHFARVTWNPLMSPGGLRRVSIPDFTGNLLLFTPFGCFGAWALRRWLPRGTTIAALTLLSFALSFAVEFAQLFTIDRTSSVADVFANTIGGFVGAVGGVVLATTMRAVVALAAGAGMTEAVAFFPCVVALALVCAGAWEPFDVTLDVGSVLPKLRLFLLDPIQAVQWSDEVLSLLQHLLFTSAFVVWLHEIRVRSAAIVAALVGAVLAIGCEASQLFIAARMPGLWDAFVALIGAGAGVPIGLAFVRRRGGDLRWALAVVAITAIGVAMQQLTPFRATVGGPRPFQWVPFLNYYVFTTSETVSHSAELLLSAFPVGFALAAAARKTSVGFAAALGTALAVGVPVEFLQRYVGNRYPDITDIGMFVAGAWLGAWTATSGWRLFRQEMAVISNARLARGTAPKLT